MTFAAANGKEKVMSLPPSTWQEHWFEHNQLVKLKYYDDIVAVYFDDDMREAESSWLYQYMSTLAQYRKSHYGDIRSDRLCAIFHKGKYGGGHPSYYYDGSHDFRNVIDCGSDNWQAPSTSSPSWQFDGPSHEVAHIIESTVHGKHNSPCFGLWNDSKWAEFFQYGFYKDNGMTTYAQAKYDEFMSKSDDYPRPGTQWFRKWFSILYSAYGGSKCMREFYRMIDQYWPYQNKSMNWGELIHFMSAAAGTDLKFPAQAAFGWSSEWEDQYQQAMLVYKLTTAPGGST
jgi:hypothetical protein